MLNSIFTGGIVTFRASNLNFKQFIERINSLKNDNEQYRHTISLSTIRIDVKEIIPEYQIAIFPITNDNDSTYDQMLIGQFVIDMIDNLSFINRKSNIIFLSIVYL